MKRIFVSLFYWSIIINSSLFAGDNIGGGGGDIYTIFGFLGLIVVAFLGIALIVAKIKGGGDD